MQEETFFFFHLLNVRLLDFWDYAKDAQEERKVKKAEKPHKGGEEVVLGD